MSKINADESKLGLSSSVTKGYYSVAGAGGKKVELSGPGKELLWP